MNDAEWFAEHTAYLATPEWAFRRGQVLNRDAYQCQARLERCRGVASQVHHLTYKHWRNEPLFELASVCSSCHEQITKMDRESRPPGARIRLGTSELEPRSIFTRIEELLGTSSPCTAAEIADHLGVPLFSVQRTLRNGRFIVTDQERQEWGLAEVGMDLIPI